MFGFFLKKNFCDGWDNIMNLIVPNLVLMVMIFFGFISVRAIVNLELAFSIPLSFLLIILFIGLCMVLIMSFAENAAKIANFEDVKIRWFFTEIPNVFKDGFLYGLLMGLLVVAGIIGIPAYLSMGTLYGLVLAIVLFCFEVVFILSLQWFIPLRALLHDDFKKCFKKSFIIFFDNTGFSILMFLYNGVLCAMSFLMLTLIPSGAGIVLSLTNALRLRLYKYDWLDQHPDLKNPKDRKRIPWDKLIAEDEEAVGHRTFKSFFMPWKED